MRHGTKGTRALVVCAMILGSACTPHVANTPKIYHVSASPLSGVWSLTLRLRDPAGAARGGLHGQVALLQARPYDHVEWSTIERPEYVGTYSLDYDRVGIIPIQRREISVAAGQMLSEHNAVIVLNPGPSHGSLVMRGIVYADSIAGEWSVTAYAAGHEGTFVLKQTGP